MSDSLSLLYEINTAVYLNKLSHTIGHDVVLDEIPDDEIDKLANLGVSYVWLMGVWQRSLVSREITLNDESFLLSLKKILPDYSDADIIGSAYSIRSYEVNDSFGGTEALARFRQRLNNKGIKLILDFVPNHVGPDHAWAKDHPGYFIKGSEPDLKKDPENFTRVNEQVYALGRDPTFPAWSDVLQLNAFSEGYRSEAVNLLSRLTDMCDGVRCDMAMLLLNKIFVDTWGSRAGPVPKVDFWEQTIQAVKSKRSDFLFIAEAYWDTEEELIEQGFDYCYDKKLYDSLEQGVGEFVNKRLDQTSRYNSSLLRFIENHDEVRAASLLSHSKTLAATAVIFSQPGIVLVHDGQLEGFKVKVPVHINRAPAEPIDIDLQKDSTEIIKTLLDWHRSGAAEKLNTSMHSVMAWKFGSEQKLVVINYSGVKCKALINPEHRDKSIAITLEPWQVIFTKAEASKQ